MKTTILTATTGHCSVVSLHPDRDSAWKAVWKELAEEHGYDESEIIKIRIRFESKKDRDYRKSRDEENLLSIEQDWGSKLEYWVTEHEIPLSEDHSLIRKQDLQDIAYHAHFAALSNEAGDGVGTGKHIANIKSLVPDYIPDN